MLWLQTTTEAGDCLLTTVTWRSACRTSVIVLHVHVSREKGETGKREGRGEEAVVFNLKVSLDFVSLSPQYLYVCVCGGRMAVKRKDM